jgi:hypothetical protein
MRLHSDWWTEREGSLSSEKDVDRLFRLRIFNETFIRRRSAVADVALLIAFDRLTIWFSL